MCLVGRKWWWVSKNLFSQRQSAGKQKLLKNFFVLSLFLLFIISVTWQRKVLYTVITKFPSPLISLHSHRLMITFLQLSLSFLATKIFACISLNLPSYNRLYKNKRWPNRLCIHHSLGDSLSLKISSQSFLSFHHS